jgi:hypothetical protein
VPARSREGTTDRKDAMRAIPRLGSSNLAIISIYFVPAWGHDALKVLTSPYNGFEDGIHATAAIYFWKMFDFGLDGLIRTSNLLACVKLVIAAAFVAYLIEFARSLVMEREPDPMTVNAVLWLAVAANMIWALPTLFVGNAGFIRLEATQFLLLAGAAIIIMVESQFALRSVAPAQTSLQPESGPTCGDVRAVRA